MEIKRIQLRGISRTPSDRLTEDGGVAESLNIHLDSTECAPAFKPQDVTADLGLPENLEADRVFVHKTANYENYVVCQDGRIVYYAGGVPFIILSLFDSETVKDITSIGNTLIVLTDKNMYYLLNKDGEYKLLGTKIPFPHINFGKQPVDKEYSFSVDRRWDSSTGNMDNYPRMWFIDPQKDATQSHLNVLWTGEENGILPSKELWTYENFKKRSEYKLFKEEIDELCSEQTSSIREDKHFYTGMFVRYAITLYDGSRLSSMPIYVPHKGAHIKLSAKTSLYYSDTGVFNVSFIENEADGAFKAFDITAVCDNIKELQDWTDVIQQIDIYVSDQNDMAYKFPIIRDRNLELGASGDNLTVRTSTGYLVYGESEDAETVLNNQSSIVYRIKSIPLTDIYDSESGVRGVSLSKEVLELEKGIIINTSEYESIDALREQERLIGDDMKHYGSFPNKVDRYNNALIFLAPSHQMLYDYNSLNAIATSSEVQETQDYDIYYKYEVMFLLKTQSGIKQVFTGPFVYVESVYNEVFTKQEPLLYQTFPDSRAYMMCVKVSRYYDDINSDPTDIRYGYFNMKPHPFLDMAYVYQSDKDGEMLPMYPEADAGESFEFVYDNNVDEMENKVSISEINNPFFFPLNRTYTFQSRVLGVAIATTALSQGQFGQFPLYVFTEDGIWAMETAADGSFVTSKPLSRDVCVNPDSITPIDNAVVFVTDKGVMMLSGSQVVNISPYMNGKHYAIEQTAKTIINGQHGFCDLIPVLEDTTPFMAFMKKASIAYDYAGQRLICIAPDEKYQYVYKLDTQTWHKVAHGLSFVRPINSYPECLVQTRDYYITLYVENSDELDAEDFPEFKQAVAKYIPSLTHSEIEDLFYGRNTYLRDIHVGHVDDLIEALADHDVDITYDETALTHIHNLSTILDAAEPQPVEKGIIVTRPFDLGAPDVFKTVKDVRIRGQFPKGAVKFILLGSQDGINFYIINTLRGKSWKLFRLIILADLDPTDRISWVDIGYETRFTNKLR